jgi:MFS family permease
VAGCLIGSVAMAILAFAHAHAWEIYLASGILGIGFGLAFSAMSALVVAAVPVDQTGVASGMNANIRTIGGSIGAAVMASIVTASLLPSGLPKEAGYTTGFAVMAGCLAMAALAGSLIPGPRRLRQAASEPRHAEVAVAAEDSVAGLEPRPEGAA